MSRRATSGRDLLLVGTGAYVTHDRYGPGVLARSLAQWAAEAGAGGCGLIVAARSAAGRARFEREWKTLADEFSSLPPLRFVTPEGEAFDEALAGARALFVCVPDGVHATFARRGLEAGVPTWVVKPLTGDARSSAALAEAAATTGTPLWVDYHKRFDVSNRRLRSSLLNEEWGRPRLVQVRYSQPRDLPLDGFAWAGETDVFTYIGCHYVDQLFFTMPGLEILDVSARGIEGPVHARFGGRAYDTVVARLDARWRGQDVTALFEVGWSNPLGSPTKSLQIVEVQCDRGRAFLDQSRRGIELWSDEGVSVPNPHFFARVADPLTGTERYQGYGFDSVKHFLDFTAAAAPARAKALANDALPWAREAARVDAVLTAVRDALG